LDHLSLIIPQNKSAGSVIVTSQVAEAAKLFPGARTLVVDKMEIQEAKALLAQRVDTNLLDAEWKVTTLLEEVASRLDGIPLAVNLAGARIRDDMDRYSDSGESAATAVERYITDLEERKRSVLSDSAHTLTSSYKKTIWSVWGTVLSSLNRSETSDADVDAFPLHLLRLAVLLGPDVLHRELFRSASQSLEDICSQLTTGPPQWFRCLLRLSGTGQWDTYAYRQSLQRLRDFQLVRDTTEEVSNLVERQDIHDPSMVSWPGFTMHGLVRWRAEAEATQEEYKLCQAILVAASCRANNAHEHGIDFRFAMRGYLPQDESLWRRHFTKKGFADLCSAVGMTLLSLEEYGRAEDLLERAYDLQFAVSGNFDPATVETRVEQFASKFKVEGTSTYRDGVDSYLHMDEHQSGSFQWLPGGRARLVAALHYYDRRRKPQISDELAEVAKKLDKRARTAAFEESYQARQTSGNVSRARA
jgi:hypothetical protein